MNTEPVKMKLDQQKFQALAASLGRLEDIKQLSALSTTKEVEAEALGHVEFLSKELLDYAPELLGCWYVIKTEYEPLCVAAIPLLGRTNSIISQRVAQQQAATKPEPAASNVIALNPKAT